MLNTRMFVICTSGCLPSRHPDVKGVTSANSRFDPSPLFYFFTFFPLYFFTFNFFHYLCTAIHASCGNSSVGRAQPCQGWGREFKSRLPLKNTGRRNGGIGRHEGLKIPWPEMAVRVRVPLAAQCVSRPLCPAVIDIMF